MNTYMDRLLKREAFIEYAKKCAETKTQVTIDGCIKATDLTPVRLSGGPATIGNALAFLLCCVRWAHNWLRESPETIRAVRDATITLMDMDIYPLDEYCDGTLFKDIRSSYDRMDTEEYWKPVPYPSENTT